MMKSPKGRYITRFTTIGAAFALTIPLAACGEEPQDQIIEIEDGYDENAANLEQVSLEADEDQTEASPTNMEL